LRPTDPAGNPNYRSGFSTRGLCSVEDDSLTGFSDPPSRCWPESRFASFRACNSNHKETCWVPTASSTWGTIACGEKLMVAANLPVGHGSLLKSSSICPSRSTRNAVLGLLLFDENHFLRSTLPTHEIHGLAVRFLGVRTSASNCNFLWTYAFLNKKSNQVSLVQHDAKCHLTKMRDANSPQFGRGVLTRHSSTDSSFSMAIHASFQVPAIGHDLLVVSPWQFMSHFKCRQLDMTCWRLVQTLR
jgi:hypothetical protein